MFFLDVSHRPTQSKVPYYHLERKSKRKRNETKRKEMKKRNNPSWNAIFLTQDYFTRTPFEFIVWRPTRRRIISARRNVLDSSGSIRKFSLLNEESQGVGGGGGRGRVHPAAQRSSVGTSSFEIDTSLVYNPTHHRQSIVVHLQAPVLWVTWTRRVAAKKYTRQIYFRGHPPPHQDNVKKIFVKLVSSQSILRDTIWNRNETRFVGIGNWRSRNTCYAVSFVRIGDFTRRGMINRSIDRSSIANT